MMNPGLLTSYSFRSIHECSTKKDIRRITPLLAFDSAAIRVYRSLLERTFATASPTPQVAGGFRLSPGRSASRCDCAEDFCLSGSESRKFSQRNPFPIQPLLRAQADSWREIRIFGRCVAAGVFTVRVRLTFQARCTAFLRQSLTAIKNGAGPREVRHFELRWLPGPLGGWKILCFIFIIQDVPLVSSEAMERRKDGLIVLPQLP